MVDRSFIIKTDCHSALDAESRKYKIGMDSRWSLPRTAMRGGNDKLEQKQKQKIYAFSTGNFNSGRSG